MGMLLQPPLGEKCTPCLTIFTCSAPLPGTGGSSGSAAVHVRSLLRLWLDHYHSVRNSHACQHKKVYFHLPCAGVMRSVRSCASPIPPPHKVQNMSCMPVKCSGRLR